jgi:multicomponent Na+:H+ antiporter subunit E
VDQAAYCEWYAGFRPQNIGPKSNFADAESGCDAAPSGEGSGMVWAQERHAATRQPLRGLPARAVGFLVFWLILSGTGPLDFLVGIPAAIAAAWTSLRLLPPGPWGFRPLALIRLALRFLRQSIGAGIDVAWRALDPRLPLRPGFVRYRSHLPPGPTLNAFCTMTSLLPGTLPCGPDEDGDLIIHCLDASQPVASNMAAEEAPFVAALGGARP